MKITDPQLIDTYYTALLARDKDYIDSFFVGVKTTGIFCLPTCRARKPKKENTEFYSSIKEALRAGFRPCKVCKPTEDPDKLPIDIQNALQLFEEKQYMKVSDADLLSEGIQPERVRRWFKKNHDITFQAYQRMIRINSAYISLMNGESVSDTAFTTGYESLSGFNYTFKKLMGASPKKLKKKATIYIDRIESPLGAMWICSTDKGICLLEFTDRRMLETEFEDLQHRLDAKIVAGDNKHIKQAKNELAEYFEGKRKNFDVPLDTPTTPFRKAVWKKLIDINYGEITTYKKQAETLGDPKSVRAVASANGHNRVAIIIPCHRVIGSDGSLTGYAGGLDRKRWLLDHERMHSEYPGELF